MKKDKEFDAPTFTRFLDSKGNVFHPNTSQGQPSHFDSREGPAGTLYVGETVTFEVEVDESYSANTYTINWHTFFGKQEAVGPSFTIEVTNKNVGQKEEVRAVLVSNKDWHRDGHCDDFINALYRVLPPTS